jgi:hypothetical protein
VTIVIGSNAIKYSKNEKFVTCYSQIEEKRNDIIAMSKCRAECEIESLEEYRGLTQDLIARFDEIIAYQTMQIERYRREERRLWIQEPYGTAAMNCVKRAGVLEARIAKHQLMKMSLESQLQEDNLEDRNSEEQMKEYSDGYPDADHGLKVVMGYGKKKERETTEQLRESIQKVHRKFDKKIAGQISGIEEDRAEVKRLMMEGNTMDAMNVFKRIKLREALITRYREMKIERERQVREGNLDTLQSTEVECGC